MKPDEIINKTLPIINEQDCRPLQLEYLLEKANISSDVFFQYFAGVDDLLAEAFSRLCEGANTLAEDIDQPSFSLEKLFKVIVRIFKLQVRYCFCCFI